MSKTILERVRQRMEIDPETGCWLWRGALASNGYAALKDGRTNKTVRGHRALWVEIHGPLEPHELVCHRCDVRHCCNIEHLFVGTNRENLADMVAKGRQARGEWNSGGGRLTAELVRSIRADPRSQRRIAADYGASQTCVSEIKRRVTWAHIPPSPSDAPLRAPHRARVKLTAEQVLAIRAHPGRQASIAAVYGISQMQVSNIKRRVTWAHLP